jgi:cupin fold WbuC family metalloprotein
MPFSKFTPVFLADLIDRAKSSPRRRLHYNIHSHADEPVQRLFNAVCADSYIRPHRHLIERRHELLIAVRGRLALILFEDDGRVRSSLPFGCDPGLAAGAELEPSQWHTVVALEECSILLEVKEGPFNPSATKELAPWSPEEGAPSATSYLQELRELAGEGAA